MERQVGARPPRILRLGLAALTVAVLGTLPAAASAAAAESGPRYTAGAEGGGDPYFPFAGNGGYDVQHYDLDITYTPPAAAPAPLVGQFEGVATIALVATQDLDRFNLDLRDMTVESVTINGKPAVGVDPPAAGVEVEGSAWWHVQDGDTRKWELTLQPRPKLKAGDEATVVITYGGDTGRPEDIEGALYGWVTMRDGAMVANEPEGAMTWYPVNDIPTDKATYSFEITVPAGKVAVANGLPAQAPVTVNGWTTWFWDAPDAMASYLSTASVGDYVARAPYSSPSGVPILDFVDSKLTAARLATTNASLGWQPTMITFFESQFGAYPFNSFGAIVDNDSIGYALETQTRPIYSSQASEGTVAHELAHMWLGDAVSPARWQHIWLNEGWATFATWMWNDYRGIRPLATSFSNWYNAPRPDSYWQLQIGDPGPLGLFAGQVYDRGAGTLYALRERVGAATFLQGARLWLSRYDDSAGTAEDFQEVFEEVSGQNLDAFFQMWLYGQTKPVCC